MKVCVCRARSSLFLTQWPKWKWFALWIGQKYIYMHNVRNFHDDSRLISFIVVEMKAIISFNLFWLNRIAHANTTYTVLINFRSCPVCVLSFSVFYCWQQSTVNLSSAGKWVVFHVASQFPPTDWVSEMLIQPRTKIYSRTKRNDIRSQMCGFSEFDKRARFTFGDNWHCWLFWWHCCCKTHGAYDNRSSKKISRSERKKKLIYFRVCLFNLADVWLCIIFYERRPSSWMFTFSVHSSLCTTIKFCIFLAAPKIAIGKWLVTCSTSNFLFSFFFSWISCWHPAFHLMWVQFRFSTTQVNKSNGKNWSK